MKFSEGYPDQQTPENCDDNNKDEDVGLNINNVNKFTLVQPQL